VVCFQPEASNTPGFPNTRQLSVKFTPVSIQKQLHAPIFGSGPKTFNRPVDHYPTYSRRKVRKILAISFSTNEDMCMRAARTRQKTSNACNIQNVRIIGRSYVRYRQNDKLHRDDDLPAVEIPHVEGYTKEWYQYDYTGNTTSRPSRHSRVALRTSCFQ